jgi:hypothetical protein
MAHALNASSGPAGVPEGVARAQLTVSYGMSEIGAQELLGRAMANGFAKTFTLRVTLTNHYPPMFVVTDLLAK